MQYRKKPVVIEAVQWTGDNDDALEEFTEQQWSTVSPFDAEDERGDYAQVYDELHGTWVLMQPTDWVIRGIKGEFYPCTNEVFCESYEPVGAPA